MEFDQNNKIVKLCAQGMSLEAEGKGHEASELYQQAWNESTTDFERFTSAHYVARQQKTVIDKLKWDEIALELALKINGDSLKAAYPSLYLNIGKCYEDLSDYVKAKVNYNLAFSFLDQLPNDGYGNMIKSGILSGLERLK